MDSRPWRKRVLALAIAAALPAALLPATAVADLDGYHDSFVTMAPAWYPVAGEWAAAGGAVGASIGGGEHGYSLALRGIELPDEVSATVELSLPGEGGATTWGGLQLQRQELTDSYARSGYTVLLRRNGELAIIAARDGVAVDTIAKAATPARPAEAPAELSFAISGDTLTASAGGVTVTAKDSRYRAGGLSLVAHRATAVSISELAVTGSLVEFDQPVPMPTDCVVPSDEPLSDGRGPVLNSPERIAAVKSRVEAGVQPQAGAFERLMGEVEADLQREPDAPEVWFVPFFYNNPTGHRAARDGLQDDANAAYRLALAYRITGEESYGEKATQFLADWADIGCLRTSEDSALAFSYHFPAMIFAAELLRGSAVWPAEEEAAFAAMVQARAMGLSASITHMDQNWGSWGVAAVTAMSAYLGDDEAVAAAAERARRLLDVQLSSEAWFTFEVDRNNGVGDYGIWYSHFSLFPNLLAAEIAETRGIDLHSYVNPNGVGMADAAKVIAGWLDDLESFPFYKGEDKDKIVNDRTIDYLMAAGVKAHSMSYFELVGNHYDLPLVEQLIAEEGPMTTIHAAPHLSLTHGDLSAADLEPTPTPAPTPTPTPTQTVAPTPTHSASATPPTDAVDVYSTPGLHKVNGRSWMTVCEPYSQTTRCTTLIWATGIERAGNQFLQVNGWRFNNLTYLPQLERSAWVGNPLGADGAWTAADGRQWRTECDTALTGRGGCRNFALADVTTNGPDGYRTAPAWMLNSIVRFA